MHDLPKPLQVYVVEDSPIIRRLLGSSIEAAGGEMIGYSADASTAISELSVLEPDLILIDLSLKTGSGFDVLEALNARESRRSALKVVLTNHASEQFKSLSFDMGAHGFCDKSSETSQVLALINALAEEKRVRALGQRRTGSVQSMRENDSRK